MKNPLETLLHPGSGRRGWIRAASVLGLVLLVSSAASIAYFDSESGSGSKEDVPFLTSALDSLERAYEDAVEILTDPHALHRLITGFSAPVGRR